MSGDHKPSETAWEPNGPEGETCIKSPDPETGEVCYFPVFGYGNPVSEKRFDELDLLQRLNGKQRVVARLLCLWAVDGPRIEMFEPVISKDVSPELKGVRIPIGKPDSNGPFPSEQIASAIKRAHELSPSVEAHIPRLMEIRAEFQKLSPHLPPAEISSTRNGVENPYLPRLGYVTLEDLLVTAILMLKRFVKEVAQMPLLRDVREARAVRKRAAWFLKRDAIAYALFRLLTEQAESRSPHMAAYTLIGRFERDFLNRDIGYGSSGETETVRKQIMVFKNSPWRFQMDEILDRLLSINWPSQSSTSVQDRENPDSPSSTPQE